MNYNLISEKEHEEDLKRISILRYIDDDFMSICFDGFIEGAELVLNTILDRSDLSVISVKTQVHISSFDNRSIWLDVLAKRARYYKEDEKGVMTMCKVLEDMRNEVREEAREEGRKEGRKEGEQRGLILAYLQNEISQSAVMRILNITDDKFNDLVACYNQ